MSPRDASASASGEGVSADEGPSISWGSGAAKVNDCFEAPRLPRLAGRVARTYLSKESTMAGVVDFKDVSTAGLESSPVAEALAGLRANEARYFKNKYDHDFAVEPA